MTETRQLLRWERYARASAVHPDSDVVAALTSPRDRFYIRRQLIALLEELARADDALDALVAERTPFTPAECRETLNAYVEVIIEEADRDGETGQG